jgi:hypothetical protein
VVEIGKLCTEWGTNEEGMQVCTKQAAKLSVDILVDRQAPNRLGYLHR